MLMFQAVAMKIGKKEDKFTDPEKKAAENLAAKLGMILSNYNEGSALHKIDKKAIKNLKETLEEIKNNKFKTEEMK
ncbi:MAG: hypothetical protein NZ903_01055, partial [Candidatus Micrarchaeota archaeon]|nr:hypothetical protein [Candidatus Micrarchaeota archaeon]